jgi:hypothetical protein
MADRARGWIEGHVSVSSLGHDDGAALIGALLVALILSMLGTVSFRLGSQEIEGVKIAKDDAALQALAEAGIDLAIQFFHDPAFGQQTGAGQLFEKQFDLGDAGPSFLDGNGVSQFKGTAASPDLSYDATISGHEHLLNDPSVGWFRSLRGLGRITHFKIYGPTRPGLLCTVEVTASGSSGLTRTVLVQLGTRSIPPLKAGVQIGGSAVDPVPTRALPLWVHWGNVTIKGDARLAKVEELPVKTALASINSFSYADMTRWEDRWLDLYVGGAATFLPSGSTSVSGPPSNVHVRQEPVPGLKQDQWSYDKLKQHAMSSGTYYARDQDGLLYLSGLIKPGTGVTADSVFSSSAVGDHRGVVFIDTLDQQSPRSDNLGIVRVETDYAEGIFIVNAHVKLKPRGAGRTVPALSPPGDAFTGQSGRVSVDLHGIHLRGALWAGGDITFEGRPRVFGGLITGGQVMSDAPTAGMIEVWADYELSRGLHRGLPLVYVAPGTWQDKS